ncbi:hypothetical protein EVAR_55066_1 [Eumeta japonica]|uniref:Uncharacterized protein n=1 Tax=Eumeta variegata TaxID=151549 RepID=A0A4C1YZW0_EUMVA|nr:hypothetical protein EVAR_55066_1 [Eumeta japonica]
MLTVPFPRPKSVEITKTLSFGIRTLQTFSNCHDALISITIGASGGSDGGSIAEPALCESRRMLDESEHVVWPRPHDRDVARKHCDITKEN